MAIFLTAMVPAKAQALIARGDRYGQNRLVAGTRMVPRHAATVFRHMAETILATSSEGSGLLRR